jgi:hypothetical protein
MKNILIAICFAAAFASCSKKSTPTVASQPVQQTNTSQNREVNQDKKDLILDKKEVEVQKIEIDPGKMEQLKKALQGNQPLQKVAPAPSKIEQNNGSIDMKANPVGTKEMDKTKP